MHPPLYILAFLLLGCDGGQRSTGSTRNVDVTTSRVAPVRDVSRQITPSLASGSILTQDAGVLDSLDAGTEPGVPDAGTAAPRCPVVVSGPKKSLSVRSRAVAVYVEMSVGHWPPPYRDVVAPQRITLRIPAIGVTTELVSCYWLPLSCRLALVDKATARYMYGTDMDTVHGQIAQLGDDLLVKVRRSGEFGNSESEFKRFPLPCGAKAHIIVRAPKAYDHLYDGALN